MIIMYKGFYGMYEEISSQIIVADNNQNIVASYNFTKNNCTYEDIRYYINKCIKDKGLPDMVSNEFYIISPASPGSSYGYQDDGSYVTDICTCKWEYSYNY